jgi:hypothetical protein
LIWLLFVAEVPDTCNQWCMASALRPVDRCPLSLGLVELAVGTIFYRVMRDRVSFTTFRSRFNVNVSHRASLPWCWSYPSLHTQTRGGLHSVWLISVSRQNFSGAGQPGPGPVQKSATVSQEGRSRAFVERRLLAAHGVVGEIVQPRDQRRSRTAKPSLVNASRKGTTAKRCSSRVTRLLTELCDATVKHGKEDEEFTRRSQQFTIQH